MIPGERFRVVLRDAVSLCRPRPFLTENVRCVTYLGRVLVSDRRRDAIAEPVRDHCETERALATALFPFGPILAEDGLSYSCQTIDARRSAERTFGQTQRVSPKHDG